MPSSPQNAARHYLGRAFSLSRFYTRPMGLRIRQLREERGWTQEHLAGLARMSRSQLAMIERETRPANTLRLNAIAAALGVPPEQLFESDSPDARLLTLLRKLPASDRDTLVRLAESLAAKASN